ncbi:nitroreductase family protein [Mediterraneibacter sp. NSJ-55]|uniref:Nitroreductase family protein n=1 Tax=Mediterraneibacter hominis TaxID=2763054 RepID=A0A923RRC4_9FIRM|nr:nitroreductase family protein [Mediterraneibacter hominis]MBC5688247.1 nitroreductase family protein [Mediterraneibacter hominis]
MDFEALHRVRESCRIYSDRKVEREILTHLVDIARLSPSACNSQAWHFIIVDDKEALKKLRDGLDDDGLTGCPWRENVPAFILICEEKAHLRPAIEERYGSQYFTQMDIGMAAVTLCYGAADIGLGTCMIGVVNQKKLKEAFQIPPECTVRLAVAVGYPKKAGTIRQKSRKELKEIAGYNQW